MSGDIKYGVSMEARNQEFFNATIAPAVEKLPPPLSIEEIGQVIEERGLVHITAHEFLPDGVFASGWDFDDAEHIEALEKIIPATLEAINKVNDEHFKFKTLIDLALAKGLWLELDGNELKVTATFRFTVDDCEAGTRMLDKVKDGIVAALEDTGLRVTAETLHGGSPWDANEIKDEGFRDLVVATLAEMEAEKAKQAK